MPNLLSMAESPSQYSNIPLSGTNPLDQATSAATLRDMNSRATVAQNEALKSNVDTSDTMATRAALSANTTQDPTTGQMKIDIPGTLKALSAVSPTAAVNFQMSMQTRQAEVANKQAELQGKQLANSASQLNLAGQIANGVTDQESLDRARANAPIYGIDPNKLPKTYDPVQMAEMKRQGMSAADALQKQIDLMNFQQRQPNITNEILNRDIGQANTVAKAYDDNPNTQNYVKVANTNASFESMMKNPTIHQGTNDVELINNYLQTINPNRATTSSGARLDIDSMSDLEKVGVDLKGVLKPNILSPNQRAQMIANIRSKYSEATAQQQVIYNQHFNRLQNMKAQGMQIDPFHTLSTYGSVQPVIPPSAQGESNRINALHSSLDAPQGVNIGDVVGQGIPPVAASQLTAPQPKGKPVPPAGAQGASAAPAAGPMFSNAQIKARAERTGELPEDIIKQIRAKGGSVEGG